MLLRRSNPIIINCVILLLSVQIETPSRLHFALIDLNGKLGRIDGGIGVALEYPKIVLEAKLASKLEIFPNYRIVRNSVKKFSEKLNIRRGADIRIIKFIPQHVGLGSGTQYSLAATLALAKLHNIEITVREMAEIINRGGTSGIGVAAFEGGGFILDCGHSFGLGKQKRTFLPSRFSNAPPAPVLLRYKLPEDWFFVIAMINVKKRIHGIRENKIFRKYCPIPDEEVERLSRLILMKFLPSIVEKDIAMFGSALTEIQGIGFKRIEVDLQDPLVKQTMNFMVRNGSYGSGMSSFGPTVYGVAFGKNHAEELVRLTEDFLETRGGGTVHYSRCRNEGATVKINSG